MKQKFLRGMITNQMKAFEVETTVASKRKEISTQRNSKKEDLEFMAKRISSLVPQNYLPKHPD